MFLIHYPLGLEFYDKLDSNVEKLLHRVKGVCKVQQEERDAVLAKNAPPLSGHQLQPQQQQLPSTTAVAAPSLSDSLNSFIPGAPPFESPTPPPLVQPPAGAMPGVAPSSSMPSRPTPGSSRYEHAIGSAFNFLER